jgi:hypothetical protein
MAASIHQNQAILSSAWLIYRRRLRRAGRVASIEFAHSPGNAILIMMSLWLGDRRLAKARHDALPRRAVLA